MKVKLGPNAELDTLTKEELEDTLQGFARLFKEDQEFSRDIGTGVLSGAGFILLPVYKVPQGHRFTVKTINIQVDGASAGAPIAGVGVTVFAEQRQLWVNEAANLPLTIALGSDNGGSVCRNGEVVYVQIESAAGNAGKIITCHAEGLLRNN